MAKAKPRYYVQTGETEDFDLPDKRYVAVVDRATGKPVRYFYHHYCGVVKLASQYMGSVPHDAEGYSYGAAKQAEDECAILNKMERDKRASERKRRKQLDQAISWFTDAHPDDIAELFAESLPSFQATEIIDALIKALDRNAADLFDSTLRRPLALRYMAQAHVLAQIRREVDNAA